MKTRLLILCSAMMFTLTTHAAVFTGGAFANSGDIPDGNAVGSSARVTVEGLLQSITSVSVALNISGGYNGDLYAYLSYGGVLVPLLTRVGTTTSDHFGYGDTGFNITLSSAGVNNVHSYGNYSPSFNGSGQLTGTWQPDGRALDPATSLPTTYPLGGGDSPMTFASYNNLNPNGTWTLFFADMSSGAQSQVVSWELGITAEVPEPANVALGIFAGVFLVFTLARSRQVRNQVQRWRVAALQWIDAV